MKPAKNLFRVIICILNVLALAALLIAAFSDFISPFRAVIFSYFGLFFPFIFLFNLALFFFLLFTKQWISAGLSFVVFLICTSAIHTYFPIHPKTKNVPDDCIKILTYNVMRFGQQGGKSKKKSNKILRYIRENDADIVCIQEFGALRSDNGTRLTEKDITVALDKYPYHNINELKFPHPDETFGVAVFSKYPVLSVKKVPYESEYNGSIICELNVKGRKVTLINNHLESNKLSYEERNNYYQMTQEPDSRSLDVFTKMMTKRLTPAYRLRAIQAQSISKIIAEDTNPYIIVCGDFNDTPVSYARRKIKGNLRDAFVDSGCGLGITYNRYRFLFRIDYILHSSNIKSYNCTVGKLRDSDHFPVWCYLELSK
ncbi:MAG: endonuclease/exonuclease/phosphatase family protein [Dysgonamonadaceae bacterium]|nr:endonuclease/exonuclease/phosphatase family protein [Dysgonamonadaceae bacterium]